MAKGKVKWFNMTKGFGFIKSIEDEQEIFVHISALEKSGIRTLEEGQMVGYEIESSRGKTSAINLSLLKA